MGTGRSILIIKSDSRISKGIVGCIFTFNFCFSGQTANKCLNRQLSTSETCKLRIWSDSILHHKSGTILYEIYYGQGDKIVL